MAAAVLGVAGCRDIPGPDPQGPTSPAIVSDPISGVSASTAGAGFAAGRAQTGEVVYVSLPPDSIPGGEVALIGNPATGSVVITTMVDGGFDPVPVAARAGDTLQLDIQVSGGGTPVHAILVVPETRKPRVVRVYPPHRKRDVPLNAYFVMVFTEPIDPGTLTETTVELRQGTTLVAGRLEFRGAEQLTAALVPAAPLTPLTEYQLVITQGIRDLDGEPLEAPVTVEFTTGLTTVEPLTGQIAFTSWSHTIRAMNADGSGARYLTNPPGSALREYDSKPTWSSDGTKIAFVRLDDWSEIYVMNADGSALTNLTNHPAYDWDPAWSPDGTRIAFASDRDNGRGQIYVMNADGSGVTRLTNDGSSNPDFTWFDRWPTWSPDGTKIAFQRALVDSGSLYPWDIYVMSADGSGITRLAALGGDEEMPAWSPDGGKIAFSKSWDIYVMNADGSGVTRLTTDPAEELHPAWSPGGTRIAFTRIDPLGPAFPASFEEHIYVMNADGSQVTRLVQPGGGNSMAAWSPARRP